MSLGQISGDGVVGVGEVDEFSTHSDEAVTVAGEAPEFEVEAVPIPVADVNPTRVLREALRSLDGVDVMPLIRCRAVVMRSPPAFVRGAYKSILRFALQEASEANAAHNEQRLCRAWKLFLLVPRMLLFRSARGGLIPKNQLRGRFDRFARGEWIGLLIEGEHMAVEASSARSRRRRTRVDSVERRAERAQVLVALGEISAGRAALEGAPVAPGSQATLDALRDETRRPRTLREPLPEELSDFQPETAFGLDRDRFLRNLRCARRGAAAGPSGMAAEHLRPLLDCTRDSDLLWELGCSFAQGRVPVEVIPLLRLGRITALQKPSGGIRGIVVGDVFRRLVARTMAQQLNAAVERASDIPVPVCTLMLFKLSPIWILVLQCCLWTASELSI